VWSASNKCEFVIVSDVNGRLEYFPSLTAVDNKHFVLALYTRCNTSYANTKQPVLSIDITVEEGQKRLIKNLEPFT